MPRPNVLLIMTDQHRPDHLGFGGNPVIQTPALDGLAARSMRFTSAYVANPLCQPNRCSIMTMRYPSVHGTRHNGIALDWHANTFVKRLRSAGYRTGLVGKGHFQNFELRPDIARQQFDFSLAEQARLTGLPGHQDWDRYESIQGHLDRRIEMPDDFYGFDHVEVVPAHGDGCTGHYVGWLADKGLDWHDVAGPDNAEWVFDGWTEVRKPSMPPELYPTTFVAERSIDWIRARAADDEPWFLQCSFPDPHHPFTPPGRYADMYDPADMVVPETFDDPHTASVPHLQRIAATRGNVNDSPALQAADERQLRHAMAYEFGAISMIDDAVATVLAALDASGQAEDTIVIFTSDHGDMFGDHGLMLKMFTHYDGVLRVPFTVTGPGIEPGVTEALVNSLDLGETILDLCAVDSFYGSQGISLVPVLEDPSTEVRDHLLIEEDQIRDGIHAGVQPRMRTLVTRTARITRYQNLDRHDLYDLANDPLELENRWADPSSLALRLELGEQLTEAMIAAANPSYRPNVIA
ncbi:MAG: sulfatase-like hydrolase/transferase [Actinomycetota bacterium]